MHRRRGSKIVYHFSENPPLLYSCVLGTVAKADGSDIHVSQTHFIVTTMSEKCGMLGVYYEVFQTK